MNLFEFELIICYFLGHSRIGLMELASIDDSNNNFIYMIVCTLCFYSYLVYTYTTLLLPLRYYTERAK